MKILSLPATYFNRLAVIWKHIRKYADHVQKGDLASYGFVLQVWSLHIIDFKTKIED